METTTCIRERMPMVWAAVKASVRRWWGAVIFWATRWAAAMSSRGSIGKKTGVRPYLS